MSHHNDRVTQIIRLVKGKKALLVLDDVDNFEQLEALGINPTWFYNGSRIIVRTRDKRSLGNIPYTTYLTWLMNRRESLNLFTRLMFTRDDTVNTKFIEEVVNHAGGIPLVLKVWSCHFKQYEREEWPNVLETLKRIPHDDVHKQLKMSYDSLTNRAKNLFLDIACFFLASHYDYSGNNHKNLVVKVLQDENSAFFPNNEIGYLVDKCLVEIEEPYSKLWMHYAISEMGEEIVRQENEEETGKRTRLWDERDVMHVLTEFSGTEFVESICLVTPANVFLQVEAFRKMSSLRLFYVDGHGQLSWSTSSHNDQMTPLSFKKLKYMQWNWFPFKSINSLDIDNLVVLRLQDSNLEILWEGMKSLKKLRILDVSNSWYLTKTGDFYGLENLEELYLNNCINIEELHSSMVCLHRLAILDLRESIWLDNIPWETIVKLPFLRELKVGRNGPPLGIGEDSLLQFNSLNKITLVDIDIESFPNLPPNITSIEASSCRRLMYLHSKMSKIKHLTTLQCFSCSKPRSFLMKVTGLTNLSQLTMNRCSVRQVPSEIGNLVSLKNLDLSYNPFSSLPDSISNLLELVYLRIVGCSKLRLLPLLPSNLAYIEACECRSLDILPFDSTQRSYIFRNKGFKESAFCEPLVIYLDLKKKEIPALYSYRNMGHVLSFVAPMHLHKKICGIILFMKDLESSWTPATKMINKTKNTSHCLYEVEVIYPSRAVMMFYPLDDTRLMVDAGDTMALEFDIDTDFRCGLCLIYDSDVVDSKLVIQHVNDIPDDTNDDYCSFDDIGDDHGGDDDDDDNDDEEDDAFYKYHYKYHYDFDSDYDYYLDESQ